MLTPHEADRAGRSSPINYIEDVRLPPAKVRQSRTGELSDVGELAPRVNHMDLYTKVLSN